VKTSRIDGWQLAGLLPRAEHGPGRGRGRGREPSRRHPDWVVNQALELAELTGSGKLALHRVALVMFVRARWVREDALRGAYRAELDIRRQTPEESPEQARKVLPGLTKYLSDRQILEASRFARGDASTRMGMLGEIIDVAGVAEVGQRLGGGKLTDEIQNIRDKLDPVATGPDALRTLIGEIPIAELEAARNATIVMTPIVTALGFVVPDTRAMPAEVQLAMIALSIAAQLRHLNRSAENLTAGARMAVADTQHPSTSDKSRPRRLQPPGRMAHGERTSACKDKSLSSGASTRSSPPADTG
jgi:hypothetical protein